MSENKSDNRILWFQNIYVRSHSEDNVSRGSVEEFEDAKEVIRIRKSKKNRQHNGQENNKGQKDEQRSTKHNT
jgi:hypothetical protein